MKLLIPFIILGLDIILLLLGYIEVFDTFSYNLLAILKCDLITNIFKFLTILGNTKFIIILNIVIIIVMFITKKYKMSIVLVSSISSLVINNILKLLFQRQRPININLIEEHFYSFPSGHAMISVLCYGSLYYLIDFFNLKYKKIYKILLIILISLICISRVYLGVHYMSDIIGGICTSLIVREFIIKLYNGG